MAATPSKHSSSITVTSGTPTALATTTSSASPVFTNFNRHQQPALISRLGLKNYLMFERVVIFFKKKKKTEKTDQNKHSNATFKNTKNSFRNLVSDGAFKILCCGFDDGFVFPMLI